MYKAPSIIFIQRTGGFAVYTPTLTTVGMSSNKVVTLLRVLTLFTFVF